MHDNSLGCERLTALPQSEGHDGRCGPHGHLRFQVLGPVRAWHEDHPLELGPPQQRATLALLLFSGGRPVSAEELVDALWDGEPPRRAVGTIRTYVSRLRLLLEPERGPRKPAQLLVSTDGGYALHVPRQCLDADRFEARLGTAARLRMQGQVSAAWKELARSLEMWQAGTPLAGLPGPYATLQRDRLTELRATAREALFDCALKLGRHEESVTELRALAAAHPLREHTHALLIRALHHSGRRAEAFAAYETVRRALDHDLGVPPGAELTRLHAEMLSDPRPTDGLPRQEAAATDSPRGAENGRRAYGTRQDADATQPTNAVQRPGEMQNVFPRGRAQLLTPAQLPHDSADFCGRDGVVAEARRVLRAATSGRAVAIATFTGLGGVGKTALAVHVAQAMRAEFPDGQLYVDLRGTTDAPLSTGLVLTAFLTALGVVESAVPDGLDQKAVLYRSLLAGRRVLVLLDNAHDAAQVRPLLPGSPGCAVLITSRRRTITLPGAHSFEVGVLDARSALDLFAAGVGTDRCAAEPTAALELVEACGRLPLAVRIAAARLAARPHRSVVALAARLRDEHRRLGELRVADQDVEVTFRVGYEALPPQLARAFRLLALCDMPSFCGGAAAAILGTATVEEAEAMVENLVDAGLVEVSSADRYRYHDLVRLFGRQLAASTDTPAQRAAAERGFLDYVQATLLAVIRTVRPYSTLPALLPHPACADRLPTTPGSPHDWPQEAHSRLYTYVERLLSHLATSPTQEPGGKSGSGPHTHDASPHPTVGTLRATVDVLTAWSHLTVGTSRHRDLEPLAELARQAARVHDDARASARALRLLGTPHYGNGTLRRAERVLRQSLTYAAAADDALVGAEARYELAVVLTSMGRCADALPLLEEAGTRFGSLGDQDGAIRALSHTARVHLALNQPAAAHAAIGEALGRAVAWGSPETLARVRYQIGCALLSARRPDTAAPYLRAAQRYHQQLQEPRWEALAWSRLAHCELAGGNHREALACAERALDIGREAEDAVCQGRAQAARGLALLGLGETARARAMLLTARTLLMRQGMAETDEQLRQVSVVLEELGCTESTVAGSAISGFSRSAESLIPGEVEIRGAQANGSATPSSVRVLYAS